MSSFFVYRSPIGGEDRRERAWRAAITTAAVEAGAGPRRGVSLRFCLEPGRARIDLDNLVRPALDALRNAGVFGRGFRDLHTLVASKTTGSPVGLRVGSVDPEDVGDLPTIGPLLLGLEHGELPREGDRDSKMRWREAVARAWPYQPLHGLSFGVGITVSTALSFKDLLKPIIDGLEPVLGRDPRGRLEFSPNDHLITWLLVARSTSPAILRLQLVNGPFEQKG